MGYHTIRYNQQGEPYIVLKNFGHDPKDEESRSHWTWHITTRGIQHLSRDHFGRPQSMPQYINDEQLEDLKTYNMLRRSDGTPAHTRTIYPLPEPSKETDKPTQTKPTPKTGKRTLSRETKQPQESFQGPRPKVVTRRVQSPENTKQPLQNASKHPAPSPTSLPAPSQQPVTTQKKGLWEWIKSLLGLD